MLDLLCFCRTLFIKYWNSASVQAVGTTHSSFSQPPNVSTDFRSLICKSAMTKCSTKLFFKRTETLEHRGGSLRHSCRIFFVILPFLSIRICFAWKWPKKSPLPRVNGNTVENIFKPMSTRGFMGRWVQNFSDHSTVERRHCSERRSTAAEGV